MLNSFFSSSAPTDHILLSNRCFAYASLDMFPEALDDAEHVVKARPDWPKGYYRKGAALYGMSRYEDAAVAFLQCLALDQKVTSAKDQLSKVPFCNFIFMFVLILLYDFCANIKSVIFRN